MGKNQETFRAILDVIEYYSPKNGLNLKALIHILI